MQQACSLLLVWISAFRLPPAPLRRALSAFRFPLSAFPFPLLLPLVLGAQTPPAIVTQPSSRTNIAGTTATFFVGATGSEPLRFQWVHDATNVLLNATNSALILPSVQPAQSGAYTVRVTNMAGGLMSAPALLVVRAPPRIIQQPTNVLAIPGGSARFTALASGDAPLTYQWFHDLLVPVPNATNATLLLTNLTLAQAGTYQAMIENPFGAANSVEAALIIESPPTITQQPSSLVVTQGHDAAFTVGVSGDAPLYFQWYVDGINLLANATNSTLLLTNAQRAHAGSYFVRVTNRVGVVDSLSRSLQVRLPPSLTKVPAPLSAPAGSTAILQVEAEGDPPLFYRWFLQGNALANAINPILTLANIQPTQAGAYTVRVTNAFGAVTSPPALLSVVTPPVILDGPVSLTVTQGTSVQFTVAVSGSEPLSYQWFFNQTQALLLGTQPTLLLPSVQFFHSGSYALRITNQAGSVTSAEAVLQVRVPPAIAEQPTNQIVAPGNTAVFSVLGLGDAPLRYQWFRDVTNAMPGGTGATLRVTNVQHEAAGTYSVILSNGVGSIRSREASLVVKSPPTVVQQPASLVVTQGSPAVFYIIPGGDGPFGYQWFFNETNAIPTGFGSVLTVPAAQPPNAGAYSVRVFNDAGAIRSAAATLTVRVPPAIVQQPAHTNLPPGSTARFSVVSLGDAPLSYQWIFNGTNMLTAETNALLEVTNVALSDSGGYSVFVSNAVGTVRSASAQLQVRVPPTIAQPPASLILTQGGSAVFTAQVAGDGPFAYQWYFNDDPIPGARSASLILNNVQASFAGAYSLRVTNLVGFALSEPAVLEVRLLPSITRQPTGLVLAPGSNAVFSVVAAGDPPLSYQWYFNQTNALAGQIHETLALESAQVADAGVYSVLVANPFGMITSTGAVLVVKRLPTIEVQPASLMSTQGWPGRFQVVAGGDGPFSYQWFFNLTNPIVEGTHDTLVISNTEPSAAGGYSVRVSNLVGSIVSAEATLSLRLLPSLIQPPASLLATQGQTATIQISASSESPLSYQWRWHGTNLAGATTDTLTFPDASRSIEGPYELIVANDFGSVTSSVAVLTVLGLDFGDAPEPPYPTLLGAGGPHHVLVPGVYLGQGAAAEPDGQPSENASGDQSAPEEEDGVVFVSPLRPGQPATLSVIASTQGLLNAWIDLNQANGWNQPGEQILTNRTLVPGTNTVGFVLPASALAGETFARFRFSTLPGVGLMGLALDGEVEDYAISVLPAANLVVAQTSAATRVNAGANAVITINVTNLGPSAANGVVLSNTLSSRSTFVSATATQGSCTHVDGIVTCPLGTLASGGRATITLTARINQGTNTTLSAVFADEFDPNPANNLASRSIVGVRTLPTLANFNTIILPLLESGPGSIYPANIVVSGATSSVFKVTVGILGIHHDFPDDIDILLVGPRGQKVLLMSDCGLDNALVDVSLTFDQEAAAVLPDSDPPIVTGTYRPTNFGTLSDNLATPAPGAPFTTNLASFLGSDPNGVWSLYVMDDQPENAGPQSLEGFIGDGWTLSITTADPIADFSLTQSASPNPVRVGEWLTYSLVVSNRGPAAATAVLQDRLPAGVTFISATTTRGACVEQGGLIHCDLGNVPSGAAATLAIQVAPERGGQATNVVTVTGSQLDLNPANNTATAITTVIPVANLVLTLEGGPDPILLGQPIGYTVTVTNYGPNTAAAVVTNVLPAGMTLLEVNASQGVCINEAGSLVCALGELPMTGGATIQFAGSATVEGPTVTVATVTAAELDPVPEDNSATNSLQALPAADLVLGSTPAVAIVPLGQPVLIFLAITNHGPSVATVSVTNAFSPSLGSISALPSRGSCLVIEGEVHCDLGDLNPGDVALITLSGTPPGIGSYTNRTALSSAIADPTTADRESTNVLVVQPAADLSLTLKQQPNPVWLGETLSLLVTVSNQGPNSAGAVLLTNRLTPGADVIASQPSQGACTVQAGEVACDLGPLNSGNSALLTLTLRPTAPGPFRANINTVSDLLDGNPANNRATLTNLVVEPSAFAFASTPIGIPQTGPANPYPSTLRVSGITAAVFSVRVTLTNLNHAKADDLDVLLVGPNGAAVMLMSDAGGTSALNNAWLLFDDNAAALPDNTPILNGPVRPTDHGPVQEPLPIPAPAPPYGTNLAVFRGMDPNGEWSLYLVDDADQGLGAVQGGWGLIFSTLTPIADLVLNQTLSANPIAVNTELLLTYAITNHGPALATDVRFTNQLPASLRSIQFSSSRGSGTLVANKLVCPLGNLNVGEGALIVVSGLPVNPVTEPNSVSVTSPVLDPNPANSRFTTSLVVEIPPLITIHPTSQAVTNGVSALFVGAALGAGPLSYQWQRNGVDLPGTDSPALLFSSTTPANSGVYRFRVSNRVGFAWSDPAILTVFGPPTLSDFSDILIDEDQSPPLLHFTVFDFESPAATIQILGDSSQPTLVPPGGIVFGGAGTNRTLQITPLPNAAGVVRITVSARDPDQRVSSNSFLLTIRSVNDLPAVSPIPNQMTPEDVALVIPFQATDVETAPQALIFHLDSSNPTLLAASGTGVSGNGSSRLLTLTPAPHQSGNAHLTLTVSDSDGASVAVQLDLQVVSVNDRPTLDPIPDLAIAEDAGPQVVPLSGISSGAPNEPQFLSVTAVSSHPTLLPHPGVNYLSPSATGSLTLAPLPNATGSALITVTLRDGQSSNAAVSRTFTVTVRPTNDPPTLADIPNQIVDEDVPLHLPLAISDAESAASSLVLSASSSDTNIVANTGLVFGGTGVNRTLTIIPVTNRFGAVTILVSVADADGGMATDAFVLTVNPRADPPPPPPVNASPAISPISDRLLNENSPWQTVPLQGIVPGPPHEIQTLTVTATANDPNLIASVSVDYASPATTGSLRFLPIPNAHGAALITVVVNDGQPANALASVAFRVTINDTPVLSNIPAQVTLEDTQTSLIAFTVADGNTPASLLSVAAISSNPSLVPATGLRLQGSGANRGLIIAPATNLAGSAVIALSVTDTNGASSTNRFELVVEPVVDPILITSQPQSAIALAGQSASFQVTATSALPLVYQWQHNDADLPGATDRTLALLNLRTADAGAYRVRIQNADTSLTSVSAQLQIPAPPPEPRILTITRNGNSVSVTFTTVAGHSYRLETKTAVPQPAWTLVHSQLGTGVPLTLTDNEAVGPTRFYRVRVN